MVSAPVGTEPREHIVPVLLRTADEVAHLAKEAMQLEIAINQLLQQSERSSHDGLFRADMLRQRLEGLERFLTQLVQTVAPDGSCAPQAAAQSLSLQVQAMRLCDVNAVPDKPLSKNDPELW